MIWTYFDKRASRPPAESAKVRSLDSHPTTVFIALLIMLPRSARRVVLTASALAQIRLALAARNSLRTSLRPLPASVLLASSFHSSSRRQNELPKSPFQTFVDVLREELRKNRELQDNVKQLQGDVDKLQDSEAMKKARAAYERARVGDNDV